MSIGEFVELPLAVQANEIVMLEGAMLCEDCTAIAVAPNGKCLRCGSAALSVLAELIGERKS